jgi:hypothetical protein
MKNLISSVLLLAMLCQSCKEDKSYDKYYWGEASAVKNGRKNWKAETRCLANKPYGQGIDIIVTVFNEQDYGRERLFFYKVPNEIGTYKIMDSDIRVIDSTHGASYVTLLADGDVLGDTYTLLSGSIENEITIDKKKGDELWGTFQVAFIYPPASDTIILTNGKFHTKLLKE